MFKDWPENCIKKIHSHPDHENNFGTLDEFPLQVYIVVKCIGTDIDLSTSLFPNLGMYNRDQVAHIIVIVDIICVTIFWCFI